MVCISQGEPQHRWLGRSSWSRDFNRCKVPICIQVGGNKTKRKSLKLIHRHKRVQLTGLQLRKKKETLRSRKRSRIIITPPFAQIHRRHPHQPERDGFQSRRLRFGSVAKYVPHCPSRLHAHRTPCRKGMGCTTPTRTC